MGFWPLLLVGKTFVCQDVKDSATGAARTGLSRHINQLDFVQRFLIQLSELNISLTVWGPGWELEGWVRVFVFVVGVEAYKFPGTAEHIIYWGGGTLREVVELDS